MSYVRLTLVHPLHGQAANVSVCLRSLVALTALQDGCVESFVIEPVDGGDEMGRVAIYRDKPAANRAANSDPIMAVRSQLDVLIDRESHVEREFSAPDLDGDFGRMRFGRRPVGATAG